MYNYKLDAKKQTPWSQEIYLSANLTFLGSPIAQYYGISEICLWSVVFAFGRQRKGNGIQNLLLGALCRCFPIFLAQRQSCCDIAPEMEWNEISSSLELNALLLATVSFREKHATPACIFFSFSCVPEFHSFCFCFCLEKYWPGLPEIISLLVFGTSLAQSTCITEVMKCLAEVVMSMGNVPESFADILTWFVYLTLFVLEIAASMLMHASCSVSSTNLTTCRQRVMEVWIMSAVGHAKLSSIR